MKRTLIHAPQSTTMMAIPTLACTVGLINACPSYLIDGPQISYPSYDVTVHSAHKI